jgi:hypothetical protein
VIVRGVLGRALHEEPRLRDFNGSRLAAEGGQLSVKLLVSVLLVHGTRECQYDISGTD